MSFVKRFFRALLRGFLRVTALLLFVATFAYFGGLLWTLDLPAPRYAAFSAPKIQDHRLVLPFSPGIASAKVATFHDQLEAFLHFEYLRGRQARDGSDTSDILLTAVGTPSGTSYEIFILCDNDLLTAVPRLTELQGRNLISSYDFTTWTYKDLAYYQQQSHTFDVAYGAPAGQKLESLNSFQLRPALAALYGEISKFDAPVGKAVRFGRLVITVQACVKHPPEEEPESAAFQNRFVGNYLLYGIGSGAGQPQNRWQANLYVVRWTDGDTNELTLKHGVDRIEAMADGAVVVGTDGKDLHFTSIKLGDSPEVADDYTRRDASQGELRSQGFFYKPDGPDSGVLGLPISVPGRAGYMNLFQSSAAIIFLRNRSLHFEELGELGAEAEKAVDDGCRASCVDWYGNSRPIFVRGRVLALLGYEIVEGDLKNGSMRELRRINYAPQRVAVTKN